MRRQISLPPGMRRGFAPVARCDPFGQFRAGNFHPRFETDGLAVSQKKWLQISQAERGAKLRVVAEPRMRVERQVRTVNRQIIFDQQPEQFVVFCPSTDAMATRTIRDAR